MNKSIKKSISVTHLNDMTGVPGDASLSSDHCPSVFVPLCAIIVSINPSYTLSFTLKNKTRPHTGLKDANSKKSGHVLNVLERFGKT